MSNILAFVVTHNRLSDLKVCVDAIRNQNYKDFDLLVVDNSSTDGTKEWLDTQEYLTAIHQENLGGAGGFYAGQDYAMGHGYDWVWMMDDDGIPAPEQLERLVSFSASHPDVRVLNALVVDKECHNHLSFMLGDWDYAKTQKVEYLEGINPYNGTFVHREVFEKIGYTKKEMFIWGDEIEYSMRIEKAGYKQITVTHAYHYHPKERSTKDVVWPHVINKKLLIKPRKFSKYYYRNQGYIHQLYYRTKWYKGLKPMFWYTIYFLRKFDLTEAYKVVRYYIKGLHADFED